MAPQVLILNIERHAFVPPNHTRKEKQMKNLVMRLWKEEEGQDLVEYALLVAVLALAAVSTMQTLATKINTAFSTVGSCLGAATSST